jgi:hypothetical protein
MSSVLSALMMFYNDPNGTVANSATPPLPGITVGWIPSHEVGEGTKTDTQPQAAMPALPFNGWLQGGINSMLYGRVYVDPSIIALGNLVSSQTRTFSIWNAQFVPVAVTDLVASGDDGLALTVPFVTPYTLNDLQQVFYSVNIGLTGPAQMDATYTFTIAGQALKIEITGTRVNIWPFPPNWTNPVNETLEWVTEVLKAYEGSEQRIELRAVPRRGLSYDFTLKGANAQHFDNILWGWQNRAFAVPYWQYRGSVTSAVAIGSSFIPVNTADSGYVAGQTLALVLSPDVYEILQIASVSPTGLNISNPNALAWPAGSSVYPAAVSTIPSMSVPVTRQTSGLLTGTVAFQADPVQTDPFLPVTAASNTYLGKEIILEQPDWVNPIDNTATFQYDRIDYNTGPVDFSTTVTNQTLAYKYRWIRKSRSSVTAFRAFLKRLNGLVNPVYLPSWHEDFTLATAVGSSDLTISVIDRNFFLQVGTNPARSNIFIRTKQGNFLRPIVAIGKTGANVAINIGTALGVNVALSDLIQICYVCLYRKSSDIATIQWQTQQVAIIEEAFQLVPS